MKAGRSSVLMLLIATTAARAELEFAGYIRVTGGMKFVLADAARDKRSDWLEIGGGFDGYVVTAFDRKTETLTVTKDGASARLTLKSATIKPAPVTEGGEWSEATLNEEIAANRKLLAELKAVLNERWQKLRELKNGPEAAAAQRELLSVMQTVGPRQSWLDELIQLQSDLILFIQMRREDDENAVKTRARVTELKQKMAAYNPPAAGPRP